MARFYRLRLPVRGETAEQAAQNAQTNFGRFATNHTWFQIPQTIECDRTFARGPTEVYYLEAMLPFIENARNNEWNVPVDMTTLPLAGIRDELFARWWNRFRHLNQFYQERHTIEHYRLLVPGDSLDIRDGIAAVHYLREVYPRAPDWFTAYMFPAALPCPLPFAIFYFHTMIRQADTPAEQAFWDRVLQMEQALLYATAWYNEAVNAHRGYVLPTETIQWLRERLVDRPIAIREEGVDVLFPTIAILMDAAHHAPRIDRNVADLTRRNIPNSTFIWTQLRTGFQDLTTPGGRTLVVRTNGRLNIIEEDDRHVHINFNRDNSPRFYVPPHAARHRPDAHPEDQRPPQRRRLDDAGHDDRQVRFRSHSEVIPERQSQWYDTANYHPRPAPRDHDGYHYRMPPLPPHRARDNPLPERPGEVEYLRQRRIDDYIDDANHDNGFVNDRRDGESNMDAALRRQRDIDKENDNMRINYKFPPKAPPPPPVTERAQQRPIGQQQQAPRPQLQTQARTPPAPRARVPLSQVRSAQYGYLFSKGPIKKTPSRAQREAKERERLAELDEEYRGINDRRIQRDHDTDYERILRNSDRGGGSRTEYEQWYRQFREDRDSSRDRDDDDEPFAPYNNLNCHNAYRQNDPRGRRGPDAGGGGPPGIC